MAKRDKPDYTDFDNQNNYRGYPEKEFTNNRAHFNNNYTNKNSFEKYED